MRTGDIVFVIIFALIFLVALVAAIVKTNRDIDEITRFEKKITERRKKEAE